MDAAISATLVGGAYLLGGCMPGYWLVRQRTGQDVREHGSGGTGATNAGRVLGRSGYLLVLLLDAAKGALAAGVARWLELPESWRWAVAFAVVAGHVWPALLGFRGGRGVATLIGVWLVLAPWALLPCAALTLVAIPLIRRFTLAGLCGLCLLPAATWWASAGSSAATLAAAVTLLVVLYAHRAVLRPGTAPL